MPKLQKLKLQKLTVNLSDMPLDFEEFEKWLGETLENEYDTNVLLKVHFGHILHNSLIIEIGILTFSALLERHNYFQEYCFIFDLDQKRLIQMPNDNGLYLDFFKSIYEIFTRYHRLEPIEKSLFNHIMRAYVDTTIRNIAAPYSNTYISWKQYQHAVKFVRKLLEKGYFDRIAEICRRVVCEVCSHEVCRSQDFVW